MSVYQSDQQTSKSGGYGSQSDSARSPSGILGLFKSEKKPARSKFIGARNLVPPADQYVSVVEGQEPKRRGPKPDSKPALTRRQELNRQAQR